MKGSQQRGLSAEIVMVRCYHLFTASGIYVKRGERERGKERRKEGGERRKGVGEGERERHSAHVQLNCPCPTSQSMSALP